MNTQDFIIKAKSIHGDKYDYSKTEYVNSKTKVCIICPEHGEFWQEPRHHLFGQGCKLCGYERMKEKSRNTIDFFLKRAKETHDKNYDYSKVVYKGSETPVCIICPEHGEFWMTPHQFLKGSNCPKCSSRCKMDKQEFIKRATKKFGDKFNYSKTEMYNFNENTIITCPIHGDFIIKACQHLHTKHGCPKCGLEVTINSRKLNTEEFIKKANSIHNHKYIYDKTVYNKNGDEVVITCLEHGDFSQKPHKHLQGHGCPICGAKYNISELSLLDKLKNTFNDVIYQQPLSSLIGKKTLQRLDFFIPQYNIGIEFHGRQHFEPVEVFGGEKEFNEILKRDLNKFNLCKNNGIKIKYISKCIKNDYFEKVYNDFEELIKDIKNKK